MPSTSKPTSFAWLVLDTSIRLETHITEFAQLMNTLMGAFPPSTGADLAFLLARGGADFVLVQEGEQVAVLSSLGEAALDLLTRINQLVIDSYAGLAIHAGAVATGSQVLAMPASSGSGKSTLTAACVMEGFDYVSDEALCLEFTTGGVKPYPRALQLDNRALRVLTLERPPAFQDCAEAAVGVHQLGGRPAPGDLSLTDVIFIDRRPGPPHLSHVARRQVAGALLQHSFNHYKQPVAAFDVTVAQARSANGWLLNYDDPREAAALLRSALPGSPPGTVANR
jgi:hypothetical protein